METGLSSNAMPVLSGFRVALTALALGGALAPLAAQNAGGPPPPPSATPPAAAPAPAPNPQPPINLMVTRPRNEVNQAQLQECRKDNDAGTISGEIVVCAETGTDTSALTGTRAESQKRYAQETANKGKPLTPDFIKDCKDQGNPFGCVSFGKGVPPAYIVDFATLPTAPAGSDADRISRGLPPLGQDGELSEEQERARREAQGIKTSVPPRPRKKGG
jgi:hypothetical protein